MDDRSKKSELSVWQLVLLALPSLALQIPSFGFFMVVPSFYAKYASVTLAQVGLVLMASRVFDAVTDPLVGYLSDKTKTRFGPRKPWIIAGAVLAVPALYFLFNPSTTSDVVYFAIWSCTLYMAWTMIYVPMSAWFAELTREPSGRSRIFFSVGVAGAIGTVAFLAIPLLPFFAVTEIGPEALSFVAYLSMLLVPASILVATSFVPRGEQLPHHKLELKALGASMLSSGPLKYFLVCYCLGGLATGFYVALSFLLFDSVFEVGDRYSLIMVIWAVAHFVGLAFWSRVIPRLGKARTWAMSWGAATLVMSLLFAIPLGPSSFIFLVIIMAARGFLSGAELMAPQALYSDVIDYDVLRTRRNLSGSYFAIMSFLVKSLVAVGSGLAFIALAPTGFDARLAGENSDQAKLGLLIVAAGVPSLLYLASSILLWFFPLTPQRHAIVRARIESRMRSGPSEVGAGEPA